MSDNNDSPVRIRDILRLSTTLAEQLMRSPDLVGTLTDDQLTILVRAARFLHDNDVPWPSPLQKAIDALAVQMEAVRDASTDRASEELVPL